MRPRRTRIINRALVLAALGWLLIAGATTARADIVDQYTADYGWAVCETLTAFPTVAGIEGIGEAIVEDGLSAESAGAVIANSVMLYCPEHLGALQAFIAKWTSAGRVI